MGVYIQGAEDLGDLSLDGGLIIIGQVFNELLGDGGAALDIAAGKHAHHRLGGTPPVHAVVLPEPAVLDGHGGVLEVLGHILIVHPLGVGDAEYLAQFFILSGTLVLIVHHTVLVHIEAGEIHVGLRENHVDNIHCRKAGQESAGGQENQQQRADDPHHAALFLFALFTAARRLVPVLAGTSTFSSGMGRIILFRHSKYLRTGRRAAHRPALSTGTSARLPCALAQLFRMSGAPLPRPAPLLPCRLCRRISLAMHPLNRSMTAKNQYILYHIIPICLSQDFFCATAGKNLPRSLLAFFPHTGYNMVST